MSMFKMKLTPHQRKGGCKIPIKWTALKQGYEEMKLLPHCGSVRMSLPSWLPAMGFRKTANRLAGPFTLPSCSRKRQGKAMDVRGRVRNRYLGHTFKWNYLSLTSYCFSIPRLQ